MKKNLLFLLACLFFQLVAGQQLVLKKGKLIDSLKINDSIPDTYSLYLPQKFDTSKNWPLLLVIDLEKREKQVANWFAKAAEKEGYVVAAVGIEDSLSLTKNMVKTGQVLKRVNSILPIQKSRIYVAGNESGARYASLTPLFLNVVNGVISIGSSVSNTDALNLKRPFHFIGIVGKNDYAYTDLLATEKVLNRLKFPSQLLVYNENQKLPDNALVEKALQAFTLKAMGRKLIPKDSMYVEKAYVQDIQKVNGLRSQQKMLLAEQYLSQMLSMYGAHKNLDSLRLILKEVRKNKMFKAMRRAENATFFKETLLKDEYGYDMDEDVQTHNFNNLGWWKYQMEELDKFINGNSVYERQMGNRLKGFVNALADDNIELVKSDKLIDEDALAFLYMLKTITDADNFDFYMKIISLSAKNEDFGTSLFYLEEALKAGFKDAEKLYALENTALLRINPKFNTLVSKYLKDARYKIIEE
ncbi:alpha/beta hydrolase [Flagellimonas sp. S174]|uniref:alpha/beta hydrolase n=1 Tax=Flagellimonas sp. S174 TaxID=3410790 RepID=UPI003BF5BD15